MSFAALVPWLKCDVFIINASVCIFKVQKWLLLTAMSAGRKSVM